MNVLELHGGYLFTQTIGYSNVIIQSRIPTNPRLFRRWTTLTELYHSDNVCQVPVNNFCFLPNLWMEPRKCRTNRGNVGMNRGNVGMLSNTNKAVKQIKNHAHEKRTKITAFLSFARRRLSLSDPLRGYTKSKKQYWEAAPPRPPAKVKSVYQGGSDFLTGTQKSFATVRKQVRSTTQNGAWSKQPELFVQSLP